MQIIADALAAEGKARTPRIFQRSAACDRYMRGAAKGQYHAHLRQALSAEHIRPRRKNGRKEKNKTPFVNFVGNENNPLRYIFSPHQLFSILHFYSQRSNRHSERCSHKQPVINLTLFYCFYSHFFWCPCWRARALHTHQAKTLSLSYTKTQTAKGAEKKVSP